LLVCHGCGRENESNIKQCVYCNALLPRAPLSSVGLLEIRLKTENKAIVQIDAPGVEGYIIGRADHKISYLPDIDLGIYNALENGVSRRHAALINFQNVVHVVDLGSVNGTFLNNERLNADIPYAINIFDELRLGNLDVSISSIK
jgi:pSer/pThr/pTyr-binding forkhead associated (FHA) protein